MHNDSAHSAHGAQGEGYETSDVRISIVLYTFVGTFLLLGVSVVLMVLMLRSWEAGVMDKTPLTVSPTQRATAASQMIDSPAWDTDIRLQGEPAKDFEAYQLEQTHKAALYNWVDKDRGVARIPVDEAIRKALANGLPSWPELSPEAMAAQAEAAAQPPAEQPAPEQPAPAQP